MPPNSDHVRVNFCLYILPGNQFRVTNCRIVTSRDMNLMQQKCKHPSRYRLFIDHSFVLSFLQVHSFKLDSGKARPRTSKTQIEGKLGRRFPSYAFFLRVAAFACFVNDQLLAAWLTVSYSCILLHPYRQNYVFLQLGFQNLAYEKREDVPSYGLESLLGKSNTDIINGEPDDARFRPRPHWCVFRSTRYRW